MDKYLAIAFIAGALGLAGCATTDPNSTTAPSATKDKEYVTGSRLPRKTSADQPVGSISKEDWQRGSSSVITNAPKGM